MEISNNEPSPGDLDSIQLILTTESTPILSSEAISSESSLLTIAIAVPVALVLVIAFIGIVIAGRSKNRKSRHSQIEMKENVLLEIKEAEILEPIGSGNYGTVYRGLAFGGTAIALKYLEGATKEELLDEVSVLVRVQHVSFRLTKHLF